MSSSPAAIGWQAAWRLAGAAGRTGLWLQAGLAALQALLPFAGLLAMQQLVDAVAFGLAGRTPADVALRDATFATVLAAAVALGGSVLRALGSWLQETHGRALADAATAQVQQHAAQLDLAEFDRPAFHERLLRTTGEASQRPVRLVQDGLAVLVALLGLLTMAGLLTRVAAWLPVLVAALALPIALVRSRHARLRAAWHQQHTADQRDLGYAGAVLTGRATAKDVRALGLAPFWHQRLQQLRCGLRESLARLAGRRGRDELFVQALASAGLFVAYYVLARQALAGELTLGTLVLQAQAAQRTQNGVRDLLAGLAGVHEHRLFLQPVVEFLGLRPQLVATPPVQTPPPGPLALDVRALTFRYPEALADALTNVTFALAAGERIAVVGRNGSGKSTLVKLLLRLYAPTAGTLVANGVDLTHVDPAAHRARVAVLLQDAALFELSVRDNLALGHGGTATDDELWRALAIVGLAERVRALPQQLATVCSRRHAGGVDWSVGEARRLLLARALAQRADLLVLDEPFLALDGALAQSLAAVLAAWPRTGSVVLVDHRPQVLACVDRVVVLAHGKVVHDGPPAALREAPALRELFPS